MKIGSLDDEDVWFVLLDRVSHNAPVPTPAAGHTESKSAVSQRVNKPCNERLVG